jgi:hypothetical protein
MSDLLSSNLVSVDEAELRKLRTIASLAERLDAVICEFGTEPAYIAEALQPLHDVLNGGRGFYQVCNVCQGVPVPGTGRCKAHSVETAGELERLRAVNAQLLAELHHHFGCDPECEKRHAEKTEADPHGDLPVEQNP